MSKSGVGVVPSGVGLEIFEMKFGVMIGDGVCVS
jgi:hypothetical protein